MEALTRKSYPAQVWMEKHATKLGMLVVVSGGLYQAIALVSCRAFGLDFFDMAIFEAQI